MRFTGKCKWCLLEGEIWFTKNHIMSNSYARISCISSIDTVGNFLDYRSSLKKNAYKIGLIPIISRYARKVLFSGVFYTSSIFQDGGIVMDETGRNGRNWHLAQQLAHHVIMHILSITTNNIPCNALYISTNHTPCNQSAYFINKSHTM